MTSGAAWAGGGRITTYGGTKAFDLVFGEGLWAELRRDASTCCRWWSGPPTRPRSGRAWRSSARRSTTSRTRPTSRVRGARASRRGPDVAGRGARRRRPVAARQGACRAARPSSSSRKGTTHSSARADPTGRGRHPDHVSVGVSAFGATVRRRADTRRWGDAARSLRGRARVVHRVAGALVTSLTVERSEPAPRAAPGVDWSDDIAPISESVASIRGLRFEHRVPVHTPRP